MLRGELLERIKYSALSIAALMVLIPFSHHGYMRFVFALAMTALSGLALKELQGMAARKGMKFSGQVGLAASCAYILAVFYDSQSGDSSWSLVVLILSLAAFFLSSFSSPQAALSRIAFSFFGMLYIPCSLGCLIHIVYYFPEGYPQDGRLWLVYLIATTKMTDVGGYFIGKAWGKKKLAPHISPGKTWTGLLGGGFFAVATSYFFHALATAFPHIAFSINKWEALFLGLVIAFAGQLGDLSESLLKRDATIKHSNAHLPGLGGFLDIVDAILFTGPLLWMYLKAAL